MIAIVSHCTFHYFTGECEGDFMLFVIYLYYYYLFLPFVFMNSQIYDFFLLNNKIILKSDWLSEKKSTVNNSVF